MKNILIDIYELLIHDPFITEHVANRIKFDVYPEPGNIALPYIVMSEIDDTLPTEYADNDNLALSYLVQIDVYVPLKSSTQPRELCADLSYHISRLLKDNLGMANTSNSQPEYSDEFQVYRRAKRYEGIFYRNEIMNN
ncbi:hypothetical protein ERX37_05470 [Macrococcus hajekii]|uniref:DUF3168 domain-containing protein n=1 Tax=Macrococcus hajekii TaxID=198482 RepID=A0A4V3BEC9_9STAP|nr:hypothetical protein [Macrococcus hajekii]TDM03535.1 hypothetical protein ERX37_05470 [Macrococcus hajekii]GGA99631.1 hypothetical protein GCM10007190_04610 [Macrococcus hajekii]